MNTSLHLRALLVFAIGSLAAPTYATVINGCNAASQTNVDCSSIFGASRTEAGIDFYTSTEHHVGYKDGLNASSMFMDNPLRVSTHRAFINSAARIARAEQGSGTTLKIDFNSETQLSGLVLSGIGDVVRGRWDSRETEAAQVVAYDDAGVKVFDETIESDANYVYVNFGNLVPQISTLLISSGGGLPGLTPNNNNVAYFITQLPEPASWMLVITGLAFIGVRRRYG